MISVTSIMVFGNVGKCTSDGEFIVAFWSVLLQVYNWSSELEYHNWLAWFSWVLVI